MIGKLLENTLLTRISSEVSGRRLLHDEQFRFRTKHNTSLLLARLFKSLTRIFGEKRLTGAVFLDMAKAFDTIRVHGVLF
jgi:hypothetical protein